MFYFDQVPVLKDGPRIPARLLQPIGIQDSSMVWGIPLPDVREGNEALPHLLLSSIHPDSWPFAFRMRLSISHTVGALEALSRELWDQGVNILYAEAGHAGHHHASWNVIGEAVKVKQVLLPEKRKAIDTLDEKHLGEATCFHFCNKLASAMFDFLARLKSHIEQFHLDNGGSDYEAKIYGDSRVREVLAAQSIREISYAGLIPRDLVQDVGYLHHRIARGWNLLFDRASLSREDGAFRLQVERHELGAVSCRWLMNLAFFSVYGKRALSPLQFKYEKESRLLRATGDGYKRLTEALEPPTLAVAAFDDVEHYLRLQFARRTQTLSTIDYVKIAYQAEYSGSREFGDDTRGLLASICAVFRQNNINLLTVSNRMSRLDEDGEAGAVIFVGEWQKPVSEPRVRRERLKNELEALRHRDDRTGNHVRILKAEVRPFRVKRIFLSMPFQKREESLQTRILETFTATANSQGWEAIECFTLIDNVSDYIERRMRACEAFVQIAFLRPGEDRTTTDFAYLNYEYGLARGMKLPALRMVDTSVETIDYWKWRMRVDSGKELVEFDSGSDFSARFINVLKNLDRDLRAQDI